MRHAYGIILPDNRMMTQHEVIAELAEVTLIPYMAGVGFAYNTCEMTDVFDEWEHVPAGRYPVWRFPGCQWSLALSKVIVPDEVTLFENIAGNVTIYPACMEPLPSHPTTPEEDAGLPSR